jgi:nitrogen-specific signal transduction histidine kinase
VIALSFRELQKSRVILLPEYADDLPLATGDRVPLQPVILNLLPNASDAMPLADTKSLAVLRLDGDMRESTRDGLANLYHRVSEGGFVVVDDFGVVEG